jgi:hypothetical protein
MSRLIRYLENEHALAFPRTFLAAEAVVVGLILFSLVMAVRAIA